jgi:hypothetical protein
MPANLSRVPGSVRAFAPASVSPLPSLSFKNRLELPAKKLLECLQKQKQMHEEAAQARKEVAPQPRGI